MLCSILWRHTPRISAVFRNTPAAWRQTRGLSVRDSHVDPPDDNAGPRHGAGLYRLFFDGIRRGRWLGAVPEHARRLRGRAPYLVLPILAKLLPAEATKVTHRAEREAYKAPTPSLQYGWGAGLLVHKLGVTRAQGHRLHDLHHERYNGYWRWSDRKIQRAYDDGELVALDGRGFRGADRRPGKAVHLRLGC